MRGKTPIAFLALLALSACSSGGGGGGGGGSHHGPGTGTGTGTGTGSGSGTGTGRGPAYTTPSDDPDDWYVDPNASYGPVASPPQWVVPSPALPPNVRLETSNNNCALCFFEDRLFLAFRTAETHFASPNARMYVVSSRDLGLTWEFELEIAIGADVREPSLISIAGQLVLHYFEAGTNPVAFEPRQIWQRVRRAQGIWTAPVGVGLPGEVPWDLKVRGGRAWKTSYVGNHYGSGPSAIDVRFETSADGIVWQPVDPTQPVVYSGGVSEVGFEFDEQGDLWAVTRNEDGDATGWGSHVATAPAGALASWAFPAVSDPERYDSPEMIRHGKDLYLLARRDVGGPYDMGLRSLSFDQQKYLYLGAYSIRPKRTALYAIDRAQRRVQLLQDLEGDGDTAFPAVARLDADTYLFANYTSPLGNPDRAWIHGQVSPEGTQIYLSTLTFVRR